ncbi:MAG: hypothetical protein ACREBC_00860, partial [Pyrinomonadaceae bacterium]
AQCVSYAFLAILVATHPFTNWNRRDHCADTSMYYVDGNGWILLNPVDHSPAYISLNGLDSENVIMRKYKGCS